MLSTPRLGSFAQVGLYGDSQLAEFAYDSRKLK